MTNGTSESPARLLIALDGSLLAEDVLPLARGIATALGAGMTLLHVLEHRPPATVHGQRHLTTLSDAEAYLERIAAGLRLTGIDVDTHVHPNPERDVAAGIAGHAAELAADMIVLAAHGAGGLREWLVGRIPQQVAARAGIPVLIVPAPSKRQFEAIQRILLPMDQAGEARAGLPVARRLAMACGAEVKLVTVVPTRSTVPGDAGAATVFLPHTAALLLDWAEDQARAMLEQLAGSLAESALVATTEVRRGDPVRELLRAIAAYAPDLVIMATHGRIGLDGLLAGSVGSRVIAALPCPLLLVPIRNR